MIANEDGNMSELGGSIFDANAEARKQVALNQAEREAQYKRDEEIRRQQEAEAAKKRAEEEFARKFPLITPEMEQSRARAYDNPYFGEDKANAMGVLQYARGRQNRTMDQGLTDRNLAGFGDAQGQAGQTREQQLANMQRMQQMGAYFQRAAEGGAVSSAANATLQQGRDQSVQNAIAIANSGRGNRGLAMRQAQTAGAGAMQNASNQAVILAGQEQQAARQNALSALSAYGALAGNVRGQDFEAARNYLGARGQDIDIATSNLRGGIEQDQQGFANRLAASSYLNALHGGEVNRNISRQGALDNVRMSSLGLQQSADQAAHQQTMQGLGIGANVLSTGLQSLFKLYTPEPKPEPKKDTGVTGQMGDFNGPASGERLA